MIYTTGGMRVARVSLVSGSGETVFDEFVQLDHDLGVHVLDFNTRFSGITPEAYAEKARLSLGQIRQRLDKIMDRDTILVGHALENDLKTLRIVHGRCVDTVELFPHKNGRPYKRALRDLYVTHPFVTTNHY
jgi:RNA exonuclease 1